MVHRFAFSLICSCLVVCLIGITISSFGTVVKSKAKAKSTSVSMGLSSESIPKPEVLKRIAGYRALIQQRQMAMAKLYDPQQSPSTMDQALQRAGATHPVANQWAQKIFYVVWNTTQHFYVAHDGILAKSAETIAKGSGSYVKTSDMTYLDSGMQAWQSREVHVGKLYEILADQIAKQAYLMGAQYNLSMGSPQQVEMQARADVLSQASRIIDKQLRDMGYRERLFSAIGDTKAAPVAQVPKLCGKPQPLVLRPYPNPLSWQTP